jgi:transcriptional regulator with XRE-family HTH domain
VGRAPKLKGPQVTQALVAGAVHPVRRLRHTRWLTLFQLQQMTGIHFSVLSRIERGQVWPSPPKQRRIAEALGVEVSALFEQS